MDANSFSTTYDATDYILTVDGDIDEVSGPELRDAIREHSAGYSHDLVVDLTPVTFLPSLAIGVLAVAMKTARESGATVELVAADESLAQRVLNICALPHRTP